MKLNYLDWISISIYVIAVLYIGIYLTRKSINSISDFFTANKEIPWWLSGISMVATTFAADTPLAVTGIVILSGISGNWVWWGFILSGLFTTFLFAKLWHRSNVTTDTELIEMRYAGKPAQFLRGFRAIYLAIPINCIILGWVTSAMAKIIYATTGQSPWQIIVFLYLLTTIYITISGIRGVIFTDFLQFFVALFGSFVVMYYAVNHDAVGGIKNLVSNLYLSEQYSNHLNFLPSFKEGSTITLLMFCVYAAVQWWSTWYPGAEPGGGGYIAQRMFSSKTDKDALKASFLFNIFHYAVRPWPWIITALCILFIYPITDPNSILKTDAEISYAYFMIDFIPSGLRGLLIVAFLSAFMSTVSTQINWGSSYIVNDFYARFIRKKDSFKSSYEANRHYVLISRLSTILIMLLSMLSSYFIDSIQGAWKLLISIGAGTGLVYMLRWYWWRVNAYSEISAMIAALLGYLLSVYFALNEAYTIIATTIFTTFVWISITLLTPPEPKKILLEFYEKVRPPGNGWKKISNKHYQSLIPSLINVFLGLIAIQGFLFGTGKILLQDTYLGISILFLGIVAMIVLVKRINFHESV